MLVCVSWCVGMWRSSIWRGVVCPDVVCCVVLQCCLLFYSVSCRVVSSYAAVGVYNDVVSRLCL